MAEGKPEKVFEKLKKKWSGYYVGLILCNAAFNPYRYSGETYRGMEVTQEDFARYKSWHSFDIQIISIDIKIMENS